MVTKLAVEPSCFSVHADSLGSPTALTRRPPRPWDMNTSDRFGSYCIIQSVVMAFPLGPLAVSHCRDDDYPTGAEVGKLR